MKNLGLILFAVGLAGVGLLSIVYQGFALAWQPVTTALPYRGFFACVSGCILLVGGSALLLPRTANWGAIVLAAFVSVWLLGLQLPLLVANPKVGSPWVTFAETVMLTCGGWILVAALLSEKRSAKLKFIRGRSFQRTLRILFAVALPLIGLSHFVAPEGTARMIPAWIPFRVGFAYLTGACHIAAGLSMLIGFAPRLAAALEAAMIGSFVLLVHVPLLIADPSSRLFWTLLFIATACSGASWIVASSYSKSASGDVRNIEPTVVPLGKTSTG